MAEAVRRGCQVVVAAPPHSLVAEHAAGRWSTILPTTTRDQLATAVVVLEYLDRVDLGPPADHEQVAEALDEVAMACSPHRDLAVNPAKMLAIALADANPRGLGRLGARGPRRAPGGRVDPPGQRPHGASPATPSTCCPVIEAARPRNVFDDPFARRARRPAPVLLVLDDGADDPCVREQRGRLAAAAADARRTRRDRRRRRGHARWRATPRSLLSGRYAAAYLAVGLVERLTAVD